LLGSLVVPVEKFTSTQRSDAYVRLKDWGVSATAVLSLPGVDITSITAFRKNQSSFLSEFAMAPYALFQANVDIKKKTFYQELRAVSNGSGPLSYIAGASYLRAQFDGLNTSNVVPPTIFKAPAGNGGYVVSNWSAYLQLGYDLTDNLNLAVSGRYIHERNTDRPAPGVPARSPLTENKFLPAATLSYKLEGGGNVYARWARGFKAGGVVPEVDLRIFPDPYTQGGIFKGEDIDTFEVGVRTPLLDRRVNLTAAVFYNDYRNVQVSAHANLAYQAQVSVAVVNAGSARTYGAEIGINARVADPLTLGVTAGYLNAKYKRLSIPATNPVLEPFDLSGTRMINSPEWQASFSADLDQPITDQLRLVGNAVASYTSDVLWQQAGSPFLPPSIGEAFWLVNARLGIKSADDNWELAVYAKNLFNTGYTTFGNSAAGYGTIYLWGDPRIVGFEGTFKF
jgi:iron complex outermembrane receptor protein